MYIRSHSHAPPYPLIFITDPAHPVSRHWLQSHLKPLSPELASQLKYFPLTHSIYVQPPPLPTMAFLNNHQNTLVAGPRVPTTRTCARTHLASTEPRCPSSADPFPVQHALPKQPAGCNSFGRSALHPAHCWKAPLLSVRSAPYMHSHPQVNPTLWRLDGVAM